MPRLAPRAALSALLVGLMTLLPLPAMADVGVQFEVSAVGSRVVVSGNLSGDDALIRRRTAIASVNGTEIGRARTKNNGRFTIEADVQLTPGRHTATVGIEGEPALGAVDFIVGDPDGANRPSGVTPTQPPTAAKVKLTASGPESAVNGEMITIAGKVTAGGKALSGAGIAIADAFGEVPDSFSISAHDGRFQTLYLVPEQQPEGNVTLTVSFEGANGFTSASTQVSFTVIFLDDPVDEPSPAPSPTPTPSLTPTAEPSPTPLASAPSTEAPEDQGADPVPADPDPMPWAMLAIGAAGALGTAGAVVVAARRGSRRHRREHAFEHGEGGLDFLDDPDDRTGGARPGPARHAR